MGCVVLGYDDSLPARATLQVAIEQAKVFGDEEYFYVPTVVSGLRQDDEASQHEIFGPVINSGRGKDLSMYGPEGYTRIKHVMTKIA